jgi:hypothetical protein
LFAVNPDVSRPVSAGSTVVVSFADHGVILIKP